MDSSKNADDVIETGLENIHLSTDEEDPDDKNDQSVLEIPTFGFTEKSWRTDFILIVEGTRLYVNKAILSVVSPVFDTMFQSDFKESACDELELPGKKLRDVADFLRYIYPCTLSKMTQESALNILPLAEEYQVLQLKPRCETALLEHVSKEIPVEELFHLLQKACMYNLVDLRKQCVQIACKKSEDELDEAFQNNMPPAEAAREILAQSNKKLRDMLRKATESTETIKANNCEQERQLVVLKQYLSADVRKNNLISVERDCNWRDATTIIDVDMKEKSINAERELTIWNVSLDICISERSGKPSYLQIEITCKDENMISKLKGRVIFVNRQPQGENETVFFDGSFSCNRIRYYGRIRQDLMQMSSVKDISKGFMSDSHIGIIIQIYMSEPNKG